MPVYDRPASPTSPDGEKKGGKVSKSVHKADLKRKRHAAQMEKNMRPLLWSALLSLVFASLTILFMLKAVPWIFFAVKNNVWEVVKWYKGAELLAEDIINERTLELHVELTQGMFKDQFLQKAPVMFAVLGTLKKVHYEQLNSTLAGKLHGDKELTFVDQSAPSGMQTSTLDAFLQAAQTAGMQEECRADPDEDDETTTAGADGKSCASGRATFVEYVEGAEHILKSCGIDNTIMRVAGKPSPQQQQSKAKAAPPDLGGPLQMLLARSGRGPAFRQGRQFWAEAVHGTLQWVLFHPQSLPAAGYGANETMSAWMTHVYPKITARDAPVLVSQSPGQVIYVPEGWFYTYSSATPLAAAVMQQSAVEQVGSPLYCLQEGRRRLSLGDVHGAQEVLMAGVDKTMRTGAGQWIAYLTSLMGRAGVEGPTGDGRGRIPFHLLLELGAVYTAQGETSLAEVAFRDAISYNARYTPSFELYIGSVLTGLEEDMRGELRKLHPKSPKACSERAIQDYVKEAAVKVSAALALAKTSKSCSAKLESMQTQAQLELFAPHAGSGQFCHAQLLQRQPKLALRPSVGGSKEEL